MFLEEDLREDKPNTVEVSRTSRGEGIYAVFRMRNKTDLIKFAALVDDPILKTMKVGSKKNITWVKDASVRNPMDQFSV